jgi:hypothetical protein
MNPRRMPPPRPNPAPPPGGRRPSARALPLPPFSPTALRLLVGLAALGALGVRLAGMRG